MFTAIKIPPTGEHFCLAAMGVTTIETDGATALMPYRAATIGTMATASSCGRNLWTLFGELLQRNRSRIGDAFFQGFGNGVRT